MSSGFCDEFYNSQHFAPFRKFFAAIRMSEIVQKNSDNPFLVDSFTANAFCARRRRLQAFLSGCSFQAEAWHHLI